MKLPIWTAQKLYIEKPLYERRNHEQAGIFIIVGNR